MVFADTGSVTFLQGWHLTGNFTFVDLVAAAYDGVMDVTAAIKAIVAAPRHELAPLEVNR